MVVNRSLLTTLLRLLTAACVAVVVTLGAAGAAFAQETENPSADSSSSTDSSEVEEQGEDSGFSWSNGIGALNCIPAGATVSAALNGLGALVDVDTDFVPTCGEGVGEVVDAGVDKLEDVAGGAVEKVALAIGNAGVLVLKFALGWWATIDTLDATVFQETVAQINDYTFYLQVGALALSLILLGGRLALARSGAIRDTSEEGLRQMARATVISGALSGLIVIGTRLGDNIADWFITGVVGPDPTRLAEAMIQITLYTGPAGIGLLFVIGIICILGGLMMAFLMLLRTGILVLMAAALPIAGSAGGTKVGSQAYDKMLAWTFAFMMVKPVGAFVIVVSAILFLESVPSLTQPGEGDGLMALSGAILLCAAALVLPALMRLIVPNLGELGGGGSGIAAVAGLAGLIGAGAEAAGMLATGGVSGAAGAGSTSASATSTQTPPPRGAAPTGFGAVGNPAGGQQGTPPSGGGAGTFPQGNGSGTSGSNGQPGGNGSGSPAGSQGDSSRMPVASGAGHQFNRGGFEQ